MNNNGIYVGGNLTVAGGNVVNAAAEKAGGRRPAAVDVLVIAALPEEYEAAKAVVGSARWQERDGVAPYATATLRTTTGRPISIALARPIHMGGRSTSPIATALADELKPTCLAMCGVCAGNPDDTAPGDVVVAAPAYEWDEGKRVGGTLNADHQQFPLDARWTRTVQDFEPDRLPSHGAASDEEADVWYLERLYRDQDPRTHPARKRYFNPSAWRAALERMQTAGLIGWHDGRLALTDKGSDHIQRILYVDVDGPVRLPFAVYAGPMASGSVVMSDPDIWGWLKSSQRTVLALDMEAATIATVSRERRVPHWLVAKGVMDHADFDKDDRFKAFAAKASAEVLFAILEKVLSPAGDFPGNTRIDPEVPGSVMVEIVRKLTYDWPDLVDLLGVPSYDVRRFRAGDEARELWHWLKERHRLPDLAEALDEIGHRDLADLLRAYLR